jgi:hypothetical protein
MALYENIKGMAELKRNLNDLPARIQKNVLRTAIFRAAQTIRDVAKLKLQANGNVRSGKLLKDIKASRSQGSPSEVVAKVEAGSRKGKRSAWYGFLVERGHAVKRAVGYRAKARQPVVGQTQITRKTATVGHVPASPFLVPALEENREKIKLEILKGIQEEMAKAFAKLSAKI